MVYLYTYNHKFKTFNEKAILLNENIVLNEITEDNSINGTETKIVLKERNKIKAMEVIEKYFLYSKLKNAKKISLALKKIANIENLLKKEWS